MSSGYDTIGGGASCPQCPIGVKGDTSGMYGPSGC